MYPSNSGNYCNNSKSFKDIYDRNVLYQHLQNESNKSENSSNVLKGIPLDIPKSRHGFPPKPIQINNWKNTICGETNNSSTRNLLQPRIPVKHLLHTGVPIALFHKSYQNLSKLEGDVSVQPNKFGTQNCYELDSLTFHQTKKINNMMTLPMTSISTDSNGSSISTKTQPSAAFTTYTENIPFSKRTTSTKTLEGMVSETSANSNIESAGSLINTYYDSRKPPDQPNSWVLSKCRNCAAPFVPKYKIIHNKRYPKEKVDERNISQVFKADRVHMSRNIVDITSDQNERKIKRESGGTSKGKSKTIGQSNRNGDDLGSNSYGQSHKSNCSSISTSTNNDNSCSTNDVRTGFCSSIYEIEPQPLSRSTSSGIGATLSQSRASSTCGITGHSSIVNISSTDSFSEASVKTVMSCKQNQNLQEIDNKVVPTNSPYNSLKRMCQDKLENLSISQVSMNDKDNVISQNHEPNLVPPNLLSRGTYDCEHKTTVENYNSGVPIETIENFVDNDNAHLFEDTRPSIEKMGTLCDIFASKDYSNEPCVIETRKYQKFCSGECRISYRQVRSLKRQRSRQLERQQSRQKLRMQQFASPPIHQTIGAEKNLAKTKINHIAEGVHVNESSIPEINPPAEEERNIGFLKSYQHAIYNNHNTSEKYSPSKKYFPYLSDDEEWEDDDDDDDEEGYTNIDEFCYDEDLRYTDIKNKNSLFF